MPKGRILPTCLTISSSTLRILDGTLDGDDGTVTFDVPERLLKILGQFLHYTLVDIQVPSPRFDLDLLLQLPKRMGFR